MQTSADLEYEGTSFINFRDFDFPEGGNPSRQWIDIKQFTITAPPPADRDLLSALIGDQQFRDDYIGGGVDPQGTRHGPYWIDRITPDSYTPASADSVIALVTRWVDQCGIVPDALRQAIDQEVFGPARTATHIVTLPRLDASAVNDYGFIHNEFHEIIRIDTVGRTLRLTVAADD
ncbi:hypothetical protein [Nocardia testacea]|uniref:hypothetical protein n=1 Tax=Nocardia testacea TaxID=248551 RepID=UPI000308BB0D|nr:hypothetical protein [Nocardia testacea]